MTVSAFAEVVILDWENSEMGISDNPKWLKAYLKNKDDSIIRKKFELDSDCLIFVGIVDDNDFESIKKLASIKAIENATKRLKNELNISDENQSVRISGLDTVWTFWQEISDVKDKNLLDKVKAFLSDEDEESEDKPAIELESVFRGYCIYSISREMWEKCKDANK